MQRLSNPYPVFLDARGAMLDAGSIYVGVAGQDPTVGANQINLFWDQALTLAAPQPLRTQGGLIVNGANPAFVYMAEADYSITVKDADGALVSYTASTAVSTVSYQPLDSDLAAIAALATTAFGRNLLTLANTAALKSATGIVDCLPLTGGTVSANIVRLSAGAHTYHTDPAMTSGRIFLTASGASDPTSLPGDIWLRY